MLGSECSTPAGRISSPAREVLGPHSQAISERHGHNRRAARDHEQAGKSAVSPAGCTRGFPKSKPELEHAKVCDVHRQSPAIYGLCHTERRAGRHIKCLWTRSRPGACPLDGGIGPGCCAGLSVDERAYRPADVNRQAVYRRSIFAKLDNHPNVAAWYARESPTARRSSVAPRTWPLFDRSFYDPWPP